MSSKSPATIILWYWLPFVLVATAVFYASSVPDLKSTLASELDLIVRKFAHAFEFALFAFLFARAMAVTHGWYKPLRVASLVLGLTILYAISDELHQSYVIGRVASVMDVLIDSGGALFGAAAWLYWQERALQHAASHR